MKRLLSPVILLLATGAVFGDMVAMTDPERELKEKVAGSPTVVDVVAAFNSSHHLVYGEAVKWMIVNRDLETWAKVSPEKSKLKGTAYHLYPILDYMAENPLPKETPLVLALKPEHLKMLAKKGDDLPPRYEYSYVDPPLDEVFYQVLAEDLQTVSTKKNLPEAANLLLQYRAPTEKLESAIRKLSISDKTTSDPAKPQVENPDTNSGRSSSRVTESKQSQQTDTPKSDNAPTSKSLIAGLVFAICVVILAAFKLLKRK